jgi:hypothetical protein
MEEVPVGSLLEIEQQEDGWIIATSGLWYDRATSGWLDVRPTNGWLYNRATLDG